MVSLDEDQNLIQPAAGLSQCLLVSFLQDIHTSGSCLAAAL